MSDLSFLVVNSKDFLATSLRPLLESRVSFPVYQDTEEEDVWNTLEGGKDDMYIYDKCGRLTYFIPFPLSIIDISTNRTAVLRAIISTYNENPCGSTCEVNDTLVENTIGNKTEVPNEADDVKEHDGILLDIDISTNDNSTKFNQTEDMSTNTTHHSIRNNDVKHVLFMNTNNEELNATQNNTEEIVAKRMPDEEHNSLDMDITITSSESRINNSLVSDHDESHGHHHQIRHISESDTLEMRKTRRKQLIHNSNLDCLDADDNVCQNWSKRRLNQALECCQQREQGISRGSRICKKYRKRKCKKMKVVFKCCLTSSPVSTEVDEDAEVEITSLPPLQEPNM